MTRDTSDAESEFGPPSFYDAEPPDGDLWFLLAPQEEQVAENLPWVKPLSAAHSKSLFDVTDWQKAEGQGAQNLATAAAALARLDERLKIQPIKQRSGLIRRLAIVQARELLWQDGVRIAPDQLALWLVLRQASDDMARSLSQADWAVRRLCGSAHPAEGLAAFVERQPLEGEEPEFPVQTQDLFTAARGEEFAIRAGQWQEIVAGAAGLHPLTQGAMAQLAWVALEISKPGQRLEADVAAAKWASAPGVVAGQAKIPAALPFVPLAVLTGGGIGKNLVVATDGAGRALITFLKRAEEGAMAGLRLLDQLDNWRAGAIAATSELSGRMPPLLIELFLANPVLSVPMIVKLTGAAQPTALRNLKIFEERRLVYETTGQGRYRFWAVRV